MTHKIQQLIQRDLRFQKQFPAENEVFDLCISQAFSMLLSFREKCPSPLKLKVSCNRSKDHENFDFEGETYLQYFYLEYWKDDELVAVATLGLKNHSCDDYGKFEDCHLIGVYYHTLDELEIVDGFDSVDDWQTQMKNFNDTVISHNIL